MTHYSSPPEHLAHLTFRTANNADRERVITLVFGVLVEYGLPPDPETTDSDLSDIEANYPGRGGVFEVVQDGETLIGTVGLYLLDSETCELRKMYLTPAARGQGLGKYILQRMLSQARELGFKRMVLETSSKLTTAIQLYKEFGFKEVELHHPSARADQAYALKL